MTTVQSSTKRLLNGRVLLIGSVFSRFCVLLLLCTLGLWTEYLNLKVGYNNPRLVELSSGKTMRIFYEISDAFFSRFGDPVQVMQSNGGMTWSIRLMGIPFTDPIAAMSLLVKNYHWPMEFALGLIVPVALALIFGRVFCNYICPASLLFFAIARIRRLFGKFFYFPEVPMNRGLAWGILAGGLIAAILYGHGVWTFVLPYFAVGQTVFHALAFGTLSVAIGGILFFAFVDLCLGYQFTCRYLCPTGRLLGFLGRRSIISVRRDPNYCLTKCTSCRDICPLKVNPKLDETRDCSLCGECMSICPGNCLSVGLRK